MKLLILGATGRVGSRILAHALGDGHDVTVLVRTPDKLAADYPRLTLLTGDVLNLADLTRAVAPGTEAVVSALGTDGGTTLTESLPLLLEAMARESVRRIVTIGTAGILQSRAEPHLLRYQSSESKRTLTRAAQEHHRVYDLLRASQTDWTIVCPTYLPDGELTSRYRVERDRLPEGGAEISVPDTAEFTYRQIAGPDYIGARVGIAY